MATQRHPLMTLNWQSNLALALKKKEKNSKVVGKKSNHVGKIPQKTQTLDQHCLIQVQNLMKCEQT